MTSRDGDGGFEPTERTRYVEGENSAELDWTTAGGAIKTLEALIEAHAIDLEIWEQVGEVVHNTWTTPAFDKQAGTWSSYQNHQVKARFVRRQAEPVHPAVHPIVSAVRYRSPPPPEQQYSGTFAALIIADVHVGFNRDLRTGKLTPFHDREALDVALQAASMLQPNRIVFLGDTLDLPMWTKKFQRSPEFYWTTQPAVDEAHWWLSQFRQAVPLARISKHQGNHEYRFPSAVLEHLPEAYEIRRADAKHMAWSALSVPALLGLESLGIEWVGNYPDDQEWLSDRLFCGHGAVARKNPGATTAVYARDNDADSWTGHSHRREASSWTRQVRDQVFTVTAYSPGCLCHVDYRVPGHKKGQRWQQGIGWAQYTPQGDHAPTFVPIGNGRALVKGVVLKARDRLDEIRKAYPEHNW